MRKNMQPQCIFCHGLEQSVALSHGISLQSLQTGCQTCHLLAKLVLEFQDVDTQQEQQQQDPSRLVVSWDTTRISGLRIAVGQAFPTGDTEFLYSIDMFVLSGDTSSPWCILNNGEKPRHIPSHTGSNEAIETIESWIRTCEHEHDCLSATAVADSTILPKRLLDISSPHQIRLFCPPVGTTGRYSCLSHCWGEGLSLTTRKDNIDSLQVSVPWGELPVTFQHAVVVSRRLCIPYIWIDALCIIQDSKQDWATESTKMSSIYSSAYLTIAASGASSDTTGFLCHSPAIYHAKKISYITPDGKEAMIHARRTLSHGQGPIPLPLLRRAWVFQERLLSPRVVHFTPEEVIWECMSITSCSCGCIRSLWSPGFFPFRKDRLHRPQLERCHSRSEIRRKWQWLVSEYSRLLLTIDSDRLPAISGAAKRFADIWGGERNRYLAGCWKDGILRDLMWRRLETGIQAQMPARRLWQVPSWSWAGTEANIGFDDAMSTTLDASFISSSADNDEEDEFGVYDGGIVVNVCGIAVPAELIIKDCEYRLEIVMETGEHLITRDGEFTVDSVNAVDDAAVGGAQSFLCLKIAIMMHLWRDSTNLQVSLVLKPTTTPGLFERIGILRIAFDGPVVDRDIYWGIVDSTTVAIK